FHKILPKFAQRVKFKATLNRGGILRRTPRNREFKILQICCAPQVASCTAENLKFRLVCR
ncbi:hypothetical protein, partial [uncultured Campylobacter sp.]|uniref:hypothetical protein n=1 Tax=uncultured Campylobacter sp. TaxID=218934 RepID=UPI002638BF9D